MSKISFFIAAFVLVLAVRPAQATTIQWDLDNIHGGGYTVTGFFDTTGTGTITNVDVTVSKGSSVVFSDVGTSAVKTSFDVIFANNILKGVNLFFNTSLLDNARTIDINIASDYFDFTHPRNSAFLSGELVGSVVPLPAGLPMMAAAMAVLGAATRRRALQRIK